MTDPRSAPPAPVVVLGVLVLLALGAAFWVVGDAAGPLQAALVVVAAGAATFAAVRAHEAAVVGRRMLQLLEQARSDSPRLDGQDAQT